MEKFKHRLITHIAVAGLFGLGLAYTPQETKSFYQPPIAPQDSLPENPQNYLKIPLLMETKTTEVGVMGVSFIEPDPEPILPPKKRIFTVDDTHQALKNAAPLVRCTVRYEAGGGTKVYAPYDPNIIDPMGIYFGIGQLAPAGKMIEFYRLGYDNPFDPYQVIEYMNGAFRRDQQYHWGPIALGYC